MTYLVSWHGSFAIILLKFDSLLHVTTAKLIKPNFILLNQNIK